MKWLRPNSSGGEIRHDARLTATMDNSQGHGLLQYRLSIPKLNIKDERFQSEVLREDLARHFLSLFHEIDDMPVRTPVELRIAQKKLESMGMKIFRQLVPPEMSDLLWTLRQTVTNLRIETDELWIPWEIFKLQRTVGGYAKSGPFLCETFNITRWPQGEPATLLFPLRNIAVVLASDSELSYGEEEADFIVGLGREGRNARRIPAQFLAIQEAFQSGIYDTWHFIGHGHSNETRHAYWSIDLEDGQLRPDDISGWIGGKGKRAPLIFMNACKTGQAGQSLTRAGGWAREFFDIGAGAFIGASWNTTDNLALAFAQTFYDAFIDGYTMGEAMQRARLRIRDSGHGDPTWLAYCAFADPRASIHERVSITGSEESILGPGRKDTRRSSSKPSNLLVAAGGLGVLSLLMSVLDPLVIRDVLDVLLETRSSVPLNTWAERPTAATAADREIAAPKSELRNDQKIRLDLENGDRQLAGMSSFPENSSKSTDRRPEQGKLYRSKETQKSLVPRCIPSVRPDKGGFSLKFLCDEKAPEPEVGSGSTD